MVVEVNDEDGFSVPRPRRRWVEANPLPNLLTEQCDSACRPLATPLYAAVIQIQNQQELTSLRSLRHRLRPFLAK